MSRKSASSGRGNVPVPGPGRHYRSVSGATFVSRLTGYLRDSLNLALFGPGWITDAYFMAVRIPNILRDLFAEGALSSAFIPTLAKSLKTEGHARAVALTRQVFTLLLVVVGGLCLLGMVFAPQVVAVIAKGFESQPEKFALTVRLTRILFPVLLFVSLAALWMGFLNAHQRFTLPAFAPVAMNATLVVTGFVLLSTLYDDSGTHDLRLVLIWTIATLVGMALQWLVQVPGAARFGLLPGIEWPPVHPGVSAMVGLMAPAVLGQSVVQVNLLINQFFASFLQEGGVTYLYYGNRLMQLPYGVLGVSIATVVFPLVARQAAGNDRRAIGASLSRALEAAAFVMVPSMVGLCVVSLPVSRLAFEYGRVDPGAIRPIAEATCLYSLGLFAYAAVKVLVPAYYALHRTRLAVGAALSAMAANLGLNTALFMTVPDPRLRFWGLALASSLGIYVNLAVLAAGLPSLKVRLEWGSVLKEVLRIAAAALVMGAAAWATLALLRRIDLPVQRVFEAIVPAVVGAAVYAFCARALGCRSLAWFRSGRSPSR